MALLTKKEFAQACGMERNALAVYISRGEVVIEKLTDGDYVDSDHDLNNAFLEKRIAKGKTKPQAFTVRTPDGAADDDENSDIPSLTTSERKLKYLDTLKREKEVEKLQIEIDKKKGEVIPYMLIEPFFLQYGQAMTTEFKNAIDDSLRTVSHVYTMKSDDVAQFKGYIVKRINEALVKSNDNLVKSLDNLITEYAEKRGVGERVS